MVSRRGLRPHGLVKRTEHAERKGHAAELHATVARFLMTRTGGNGVAAGGNDVAAGGNDVAAGVHDVATGVHKAPVICNSVAYFQEAELTSLTSRKTLRRSSFNFLLKSFSYVLTQIFEPEEN